MTELCRLELARITTANAKNKNKVSHHGKGREQSSNSTSCNPFISHQYAKLEK